MPYAFVPPGYRAVLLGQAQDIEDLGTFTPLEEGAAEGALVLMRLDFLEPLSEETLGNLEQACRDAGIESWPGSEYYIYADTTSPAVYLVWQKGLAWLARSISACVAVWAGVVDKPNNRLNASIISKILCFIKLLLSC